MRKIEAIPLVFCAVLGLSLRFLYLGDNAVTFGFDQARDAYSAQSIYRGHLKILGPSASTPGLYHGVLYFYLIAPSYWIGSGDPVITNIWLSLVNIFTIIPIYFLGKVLFNRRVGLLASFLFAISFDAVQYANWMSNPAPAVLSVAIFYLGLAMIIFKEKQKTLSIILTGLGLGLSIQFEIFLGYLVLPLLISLSLFKIKISLKETVIFLTLFLLAISSMIISYLKFGFTFFKGVSSLYNVGGDPFGAWRDFSPTLSLYLNRFAEYFYRGLLPFNVVVGGAVGLLIVIFSINRIRQRREQHRQLLFLLILFFSHGFLIAFGGQSTPFINAGLQAAVLTLASFFLLTNLSRYRAFILLLFLLIVFSSISASLKYNWQGQTVFAIQRGLTLKNEMAAIDYTYSAALGRPFSINTITSPLWINTVWAYLYNWHGLKKFGFLPSFHGRDQTGYLGFLPAVSQSDETYFLIIEPTSGIPLQFVENTISYEDSFSKILEEKNFGGIVVQKRALLKPFDKISFIK